MSIQRFCPSLTTGYWPDNPEPLVRDDLGDYVKFEDYKSELEAAISRADTAESSLMKAFNRIDELNAQLSEANREIEDHKSHIQTVSKVMLERGDLIEQLHIQVDMLSSLCARYLEQLRWRKWPDEKPEDRQEVLVSGSSVFTFLSESDGDMWGEESGDAYECENGDMWLPIPELVESPQRDDLGQPLIQKGNLQTLTAKIIELQKELEQPMTEGIAYLGGYLIDNHEELFPNGEDQIRLICHKAATQLVESPPTGEEK